MHVLPREIAEKQQELRSLCAKHGVKRLALFGSAVKGTFDPGTSDLDFVVDFDWHPDPLVRGQRWLDLWDDLKGMFERPIALLVESTLTNSYLRETIELEHVDLYAA